MKHGPPAGRHGNALVARLGCFLDVLRKAGIVEQALWNADEAAARGRRASKVAHGGLTSGRQWGSGNLQRLSASTLGDFQGGCRRQGSGRGTLWKWKPEVAVAGRGLTRNGCRLATGGERSQGGALSLTSARQWTRRSREVGKWTGSRATEAKQWGTGIVEAGRGRSQTWPSVPRWPRWSHFRQAGPRRTQRRGRWRSKPDAVCRTADPRNGCRLAPSASVQGGFLEVDAGRGALPCQSGEVER